MKRNIPEQKKKSRPGYPERILFVILIAFMALAATNRRVVPAYPEQEAIHRPRMIHQDHCDGTVFVLTEEDTQRSIERWEASVQECWAQQEYSYLQDVADEDAYEMSSTMKPEPPQMEIYNPGKTALESRAALTSLGNMHIVGYDPWCSHCVGKIVPDGITASGAMAVIGRTVAMHRSIPFGTEIYISGIGVFVVEDRGALSERVVDVAVGSHSEAFALTSRREVFIIEWRPDVELKTAQASEYQENEEDYQ